RDVGPLGRARAGLTRLARVDRVRTGRVERPGDVAARGAARSVAHLPRGAARSGGGRGPLGGARPRLTRLASVARVHAGRDERSGDVATRHAAGAVAHL